MIFKRSIILLFILALHHGVFAHFSFQKGVNIGVSVSQREAEVVHTALDIFSRDYTAVFGGRLSKDISHAIFVGTLGSDSDAEKQVDPASIEELKNHPEGYLLLVKNDQLYVLGSDKRGTAYGILELSRRIGVSPWEWWADASPAKKNIFTFKNGFRLLSHPSVANRGIFINDEDWGLMPWSSKTFEPSQVKGQIGPKTHARIFELLLRLRANSFWPAMHEVSVAFFQTPGNKEMADKYGIIVGTSHCEPMMRSANTEWKLDGKGNYDYVNNRDHVLDFWETRVKTLKQSDNIYTLGIRGVHDGKMQGANTLQEQFNAITSIFKDQRKMIAEHLNADVTKVPQVFIPYKEVLDVYDMGLKVPDDVTLMWTDDNYGYIRRFPNESERMRKGGNGVYYHISYWGRPHDYLWLSTNHPAQLYTQMKLAYDKGAKDMWILNVGDIKPGEYLTELFLDMAWDINSIEDSQHGLNQHLKNWLKTTFGEKRSAALLSVMNEYYRLAYIRKPEFMGNTRTEEKDPKFKVVADLPWTEQELRTRLEAYQAIAKKVIEISKTISADQQDAWFQLIEYPVRGAAEMNKKIIYGQLARHGLAKWEQSDSAYYRIEALTQKYAALADGKWKNMMDAKPRNLEVFAKLLHNNATKPLNVSETPIATFNGTEFSKFEGIKPTTHGLGYESSAVNIKKGSRVEYQFKTKSAEAVKFEISLAPNHPVEGKLIRFEISIDNQFPVIMDYHTSDRNEEWKINVLTNQAKRTIKANLKKDLIKHSISIKALDENVVLDQIKVYNM